MNEIRTIGYPRPEVVPVAERGVAGPLRPLPIVAACLVVGVGAGLFTGLLVWVAFLRFL